LGFNYAPLCGVKFEVKTLLFIFRNAAPVEIALAQPIGCSLVPVPDRPAKPDNRVPVISRHCDSIMVEDSYVVLSIGVSRIGGDLVVLEC